MEFTLGILIKIEVDKYSEEIIMQSTIATQEYLLDDNLRKITEDWQKFQLSVAQYGENGLIFNQFLEN